MKYSHTCSSVRSALSVCFAYFVVSKSNMQSFCFHVFCGSIKGGNGREIEYMEVSHNASYDFKKAIPDR